MAHSPPWMEASVGMWSAFRGALQEKMDEQMPVATSALGEEMALWGEIGRLLAGGFQLLVGIRAQGIAEVAMDGCRITLDHVLLRFEESWGWTDGLFGKGEDLETMAVKGQQVFINERVSGRDIVVDTQAKGPADPVITVKGDAVSIGCEDQEAVKEDLMVGEALQETVLKEAVLDKGKASGDLSSSFWQERGSVNHGSPRNGFRFSSWSNGSASRIHAF